MSMTGEEPFPLTSVQLARATLIAMHVRNCLEELHGEGSRLDFTDSDGEYRGLTDEQVALINPIVRNAVADILHASTTRNLPRRGSSSPSRTCWCRTIGSSRS